MPEGCMHNDAVASPKLSRDKGSAEKPEDPPIVREINFGL